MLRNYTMTTTEVTLRFGYIHTHIYILKAMFGNRFTQRGFHESYRNIIILPLAPELRVFRATQVQTSYGGDGTRGLAMGAAVYKTMGFVFFFPIRITPMNRRNVRRIHVRSTQKKKKNYMMSKNKSDCRRQTSFSRVQRRTTVQRIIHIITYTPSRGYSAETDMIDIPGFREI